jgi:SpoVK/Ycf46/Vps4 family AAA+-type ATPase
MQKRHKIVTRKENPIMFIEHIAHEAMDSGLTDEFMHKIAPVCKQLAIYLECSDIQALLFSVMVNLNFSHRAVGIDRLANWLGCTPITVAMYINELEELRQRKILRREISERNHDYDMDSTIAGIFYSVNREAWDALRIGERYRVKEMPITNNYELVRAVSLQIQQRDEGQIDFPEMCREIHRILSEHSEVELVKEIKKVTLSEKERILFINLCDEYYNGVQTSDLIMMVKLLTGDKREQMGIRENIARGASALVTSALVECCDSGFRSDKEISLTDKSIAILTRDDPEMVVEKKVARMPDVILADSIVEKKLYFTSDVQSRYDEISNLLQPENYDKLVSRLRKNGMKTGFAMLFEGPPGTGKTESVYQLARISGRNVLQVTISEMKSEWYGRSEKKMAALFDRYRKLAEKSSVAPLLLFNECDSLLTTRKTNLESSIDNTENAIQAIILQALEDLNGILIATTNLVENLDKAFDRRFMFKVHFGKPTLEARYNIWMEKIPALTGAAALQLAETYELSGGQIDNIARKYTMHRVLKGNLPLRHQLDSWCREETRTLKFNKIGF